MPKSLSDAIAYVEQEHTRGEPDTALYLSACETIVADRDKLTLPVRIRVPGDCGTANTDPAWDNVRAASESDCGCGNERVIYPTHMREEFKASGSAPITLRDGMEIYLKMKGDDDMGALVALSIEAGHFVIENDPFSLPDLGGMIAQMLGLGGAPAMGAKISDLAEALKKSEKGMLVFDRGNPKHKVFIFAITAIDAEQGTVEITLDELVSSFADEQDPSGESGSEFLH